MKIKWVTAAVHINSSHKERAASNKNKLLTVCTWKMLGRHQLVEIALQIQSYRVQHQQRSVWFWGQRRRETSGGGGGAASALLLPLAAVVVLLSYDTACFAFQKAKTVWRIPPEHHIPHCKCTLYPPLLKPLQKNSFGVLMTWIKKELPAEHINSRGVFSFEDDAEEGATYQQHYSSSTASIAAAAAVVMLLSWCIPSELHMWPMAKIYPVHTSIKNNSCDVLRVGLAVGEKGSLGMLFTWKMCSVVCTS